MKGKVTAVMLASVLAGWTVLGGMSSAAKETAALAVVSFDAIKGTLNTGSGQGNAGSVQADTSSGQGDTAGTRADTDGTGVPTMEETDAQKLQQTVLQEQKEGGCFAEVGNAAKGNGKTGQGQVTPTDAAAASAFETKTLLVTASGAFDHQGAKLVLNGSDGFYVLIYETPKETQSAYQALRQQCLEEGSVIQSVTVDVIAQIADTQTNAMAQEVRVEGDKTNVTPQDAQIQEEKKERSSLLRRETERTGLGVPSSLQKYVEANRTQKEVKIAVIDTGWKREASRDFAGEERIIDSGLNLSASGEPGNTTDDHGHGSRLVQLLLAQTRENVKLWIVKAADQNGQATILSVYLSIQAAIEQKADVILISMNQKGGAAELLKEAIRQAKERGVMVVVSAGNYHGDTADCPPADSAEALVVSAVAGGAAAEYSNYGDTIDFCADGSDGEALRPQNQAGRHGTSYAAARVAAAAAMLRTFLDNGTEAEEALIRYAKDLGPGGWDRQYGHGYIGFDRELIQEASKNPGDLSEEAPKNPEDLSEETPRNPGDLSDGDGAFDAENTGAGKEEISSEEDASTSVKTGLSVQNTEYVSKTGYFFVQVSHLNKKMKYKIACSVPHASYYGSQPLSQSLTRVEGSGTHLLTSVSKGSLHSDHAPGWDPNDRMYGIVSPMQFLTIPGYHLELDCRMEELIQAYTMMISEYNVSLQHTTNSVGMTNWAVPNEFCHNTYKIKYAPNRYRIVYDGNGADSGSISSVTLKMGEELSISKKSYQRLGYRFMGYALIRSSDNQVYCGSKGWKRLIEGESDSWKLYQPGDQKTIDTAWVSEAAAAKDDTFTLRAQWEKITYHITYDGNGADSGSIASHDVTAGRKFTLKANGFVREGHEFSGYIVVRHSDQKVFCTKNGWQTYAGSASKDWKLYQPKDAFTMDEEWVNNKNQKKEDTYVFYAQWKRLSYTVTYDANGGSSVSKKKATVFYGDPIDLEVKAEPKDARDTFIGWGLNPSDTTAIFSGRMGAGDMTLYALYSIPVSDVKEVYLKVVDKTGRKSKNGKESEIYPLSRTASISSPVRGYRYKLNRMDLQERFPGSNQTDLAAAVFAVDHAGNTTRLKNYQGGGTIVPHRIYKQTVIHKFQDLDTGLNAYREIGSYPIYAGTNQEQFRDTGQTEYVKEGENYLPKALAAPLPAGYRLNGEKSAGIGKAYVVTKDRVTYAYYDAIAYTLIFDANGGSLSTRNKRVYSGKTYDYLIGNQHQGFPVPLREGYTFQGWYTAASGGTRIYPETIYSLAADSTIYAHWARNTHTVHYDYRTNGGSAVGKDSWQQEYSVQAGYGAALDLGVKAKKDGWSFVGWNTDPDGKSVLKEATMKDDNLTLYAIYKKEITATYISRTKDNTVTKRQTQTIYNRAEGVWIQIPDLEAPSGWQAEGFSRDTAAEALIHAMPGSEIFQSEDVTYYGRYSQDVTVSYEANGPSQNLPQETKKRQLNASGKGKNPQFVLAPSLRQEQHAFVGWEPISQGTGGAEFDDPSLETPAAGNSYAAGRSLAVSKDTLFRAKWDQYPKLEAYDRYFPLEMAREGKITSQVLLEKVKGTDREDGTLAHGTGVVVLNHQPQEFLAFEQEGSISVTYQATDSFGNQTTKRVTAYLVDTAPQDDARKAYVRFISSRFYKNGNNYVPFVEGGLEEDSVWRQDPAYGALLQRTLANEKSEIDLVETTFMGKEYEIEKPGSGSWEHQTETWIFDRKQLDAVRQFVIDYGYGNAKGRDKIEKFYQSFGACRKNKQ